VIHSNSTSGLEASLAGRPTLNFLPFSDDREGLDVEVASEAGVEAGSVPTALERVDALLEQESFSQDWSLHARSMLNNLNEAAVPILVQQTLAVIHEDGLDDARVTLPTGPSIPRRAWRSLSRRIRRPGKRVDYVASKRGRIDREHVDTIVDGCAERGIGRGQVRKWTDSFVVIDPG
jgi:hypothetical protein